MRIQNLKRNSFTYQWPDYIGVEKRWKEKAQALTDTKKSPEGQTIAPEDSPSHAEAPGYVPSLPKNSDAKIARISENLKLLEGKIPQQGLGKNQIIFEIAQSLELKGDSNQSNYSKVDIPSVGLIERLLMASTCCSISCTCA